MTDADTTQDWPWSPDAQPAEKDLEREVRRLMEAALPSPRRARLSAVEVRVTMDADTVVCAEISVWDGPEFGASFVVWDSGIVEDRGAAIARVAEQFAEWYSETSAGWGERPDETGTPSP